MDAQFLKTLEDNHVAAWNERDRTKRDELLQTIYADNIKMYDPGFILNSLAEVSDFIGKLHEQSTDFLFSPAAPAEATQNGVRVYGNIGTTQNPHEMKSMDFMIIENNKVAHLYVFIEQQH